MPEQDVWLGLQDKIIGIETVRALAFYTLDLGQPQARLDRTDDRQGYFVLKCEDIVGGAFEALGPDMSAIRSIDQLPRDADAIG